MENTKLQTKDPLSRRAYVALAEERRLRKERINLLVNALYQVKLSRTTTKH